MRFDFHPTRTRWRVSEVNSDVPGGYAESSHFPSLMAQYLGDAGLAPAGNPLREWCAALARHASRGRIALLCAPGYMEDRQIVACLAAQLRLFGCEATAVDLRELQWIGSHAFVRGLALDGIIRFYQSEWLAELSARASWQPLFVGQTPVANPAVAALSESKGFPLVWDRLRAPLDTWRRLLPETRDPRSVCWRSSDAWVLKSKYSNNGDEVVFPEHGDRRASRVLRRELWWNPNRWVAQERFDIVSLETPFGPMYPCVGVYVVEGRAVGIYGRLSRHRIIDYAAIDAAVLVEGAAE